MAAANEGAILQSLFTEFERLLHVEDIRGFLYQSQVITENEFQRLRVGHQFDTGKEVAQELIMLLVRKGSGCATKLLLALDQSSEQTAHAQLAEKLRSALSEQGTGEPIANGYHNGVEDHCDTFGSTVRPETDFSKPEASNEPGPLILYTPHLDGHGKKIERLRVELAQESRLMLENFTTFVHNVSKILTSKCVEVHDIQLTLECRLGTYNISDDIIKKIDDAKTVPVLLRLAMPFSSWYNYDLIAYIAKQHGEEEGKKAVESYEEKLKSYWKRYVYQCPPLSAGVKLSREFEELWIKVDWDYKKCSLQDITLFKGKLCKILEHDDPCCFILKSVDEGCVEITYIIPARLSAEVVSRAELAMLQLANEGVKLIRIGEKIINCQEKKSETSANPGSPLALSTSHSPPLPCAVRVTAEPTKLDLKIPNLLKSGGTSPLSDSGNERSHQLIPSPRRRKQLLEQHSPTTHVEERSSSPLRQSLKAGQAIDISPKSNSPELSRDSSPTNARKDSLLDGSRHPEDLHMKAVMKRLHAHEKKSSDDNADGGYVSQSNSRRTSRNDPDSLSLYSDGSLSVTSTPSHSRPQSLHIGDTVEHFPCTSPNPDPILEETIQERSNVSILDSNTTLVPSNPESQFLHSGLAFDSPTGTRKNTDPLMESGFADGYQGD